MSNSSTRLVDYVACCHKLVVMPVAILYIAVNIGKYAFAVHVVLVPLAIVAITIGKDLNSMSIS